MRDFSKTKRIVIKIGTATLSRDGGVDAKYVRDLAKQVAALVSAGRQVLIISSGAIGMGAGRLEIEGTVSGIKMRQACAAIGQPMLMHAPRTPQPRAYPRTFEKVPGRR